jgi:nucleoside-diphosphate-sugar epimerase
MYYSRSLCCLPPTIEPMVIIFGLGFTGFRLARRLVNQVETWAPVRGVERFRHLEDSGMRVLEFSRVMETPALLPRSADVALLIPPLPESENQKLRECIQMSRPRRIVYVSSTGVYGGQTDVDAHTLAAPNDERGLRRIDDEQWVANGPWSNLILRAAAIYGPGRGVHAALRERRVPRGSDSGITSRIHVDDLVAIIEAGLFSEVQGAWPVADEAASPTSEIVRWCLEEVGMDPPAETPATPISAPASTQGRRVDGRQIRELLGVSLKYPSWQTGIPACLQEEDSRGNEGRCETTRSSEPL